MKVSQQASLSSPLCNKQPLVVGWDIGGAQLKFVVLTEDGSVLLAQQLHCTLWRGLSHLQNALQQALFEITSLPKCYIVRHVVTMTGELVDLFASRTQGVTEIANCIKNLLDPISYYAINNHEAHFVTDVQMALKGIASANWYASASYLSTQFEAGMMIDIGSTTTDIVMFKQQVVLSKGLTDAERMRHHSLVYSGVVRTPLMAMGPYIDWPCTKQHVAAEHFATTADIYRILGDLDAQYDLAETADGQDKSMRASYRRIARMIGHDDKDKSEEEWQSLAQAFKEAQLKIILNAIQRQLQISHLSTSDLSSSELPIIGLGAGAFLTKTIASQLNRAFLPAPQYVLAGTDALRMNTVVCFPAYAVARLWLSAYASKKMTMPLITII